ncbi:MULTISPECIES: TetR/AcrR family transcriptional regulator [Ralstonia solanacearum species complex]|uniref:TetR/AcrR family transcriptional regulator n=1 Tax=Ralstonia solanacearum species complex TaxID=3116862 RepID=UPI000E57C59B|nr:TetR/AcrR family transcriptional regulator [Ralstonia solanacearum]BEU72711.1 T3SS transcriptional regulator BspR [Ralstonia pseudosolanacearum]AXV77550.1 TetR family transcriptional regulator [Ralstonia solanacearum]AXV91572.1 TetR family transcriptional regulator [Ralstonia solanacearum]AXW19690.1 TetR family transcriptional regulator [Ralstonia solanacearum]AXW76467.1 TetR family transcriptional regulator [Ralstonia solanacearum]
MPSYPAVPLADVDSPADAVQGETAPSDTGAPRARRDPAGTRRRILAAATEEFSRGGFAGARVDAIARRAETNERMLYYYYGSKEKLFLAVLEHMYFRFKEAEERVQIEAADPREAVIQLARFVWDFYYENPEFIRLLNSENLHEARHLKTSPHLGRLVNPIIDVLRGVIERGQRAGLFRDDVDVPRLYLTISALGYYVLSNRYTISAVVGRDIASAEEHEAFAQLHIRMLLAYLERPEA